MPWRAENEEDEELIKTLLDERDELVQALRDLYVPMVALSNAYVPTSPIGRAAELLQKYGRYWK